MGYERLEQLTAALREGGDVDMPAAGETLARHARGQRVGRRSISAYVRHRRDEGVAEERCDELRARALEAYAALTAEEPRLALVAAPVSGIRWLTEAEAAARLDLMERTLSVRLRKPAFRRLYGWPWWDGHRWYVPEPAVDPMRRAAYIASLPEQEPYWWLPAWCELSDETEAAGAGDCADRVAAGDAA